MKFVDENEQEVFENVFEKEALLNILLRGLEVETKEGTYEMNFDYNVSLEMDDFSMDEVMIIRVKGA